MNFMTTGDLFLAINDLLEKRHADLVRSKIGQGYEPLLRKKQAQLNALPKSAVSGAPSIEKLSEQDVIHDSCIDTILQVTSGVSSSPRASVTLKKAAKEIVDTLQLSADDKNASYPQEAFTVAQRKEKIAALQGTLSLFALPEGGTLYDIALDYVSAGEAIDQLLSERAKSEAITEEDRQAIKTLRPELIGIMGRFRRALADELAGDESLPANLPSLLFGYLDELDQTRSSTGQAAQETKRRAREVASIKAARDAQLEAAKVQVEATLLAKEAEAAQKRADEAKKKAEGKE